MFIVDQITRYFDPFALLIVLGGTLLITVARAPRGDLGRAFGAIGTMLSADPDADARAARVAVNKIRELTDVRGIMCVDRVETTQRFLRRAAAQLADARHSQDFSRWAADEVDARRIRHQGVIALWRGAAETAPSMGMIGTIIGLVQMFAAMEDPANMGPAMAVAMLTTLYGVILSAAVAGPIAGRLERLSETELAWQTATCKQLEMLVRDEVDHMPVKPKPILRTVP